MNKRAILCVLVVSSAVCAFAQQNDSGGFKKGSHKAVASANGPVTVAEAAATFDRVRVLFKSILHVNAPKVLQSGSTGASVQRAQVITALLTLYTAAEPVFTNTPKVVQVAYARIKPDTSSVKPKLIKLIQHGCIAGFGPLATGTEKTLTVQEFGDAVGFFLSRIVEMTNRADPRWTPYLKDPSKPG